MGDSQHDGLGGEFFYRESPGLGRGRSAECFIPDFGGEGVAILLKPGTIHGEISTSGAAGECELIDAALVHGGADILIPNLPSSCTIRRTPAAAHAALRASGECKRAIGIGATRAVDGGGEIDLRWQGGDPQVISIVIVDDPRPSGVLIDIQSVGSIVERGAADLQGIAATGILEMRNPCAALIDDGSDIAGPAHG